MVIWFKSERTRNQLLEHGVVISARKERKQEGKTIALYKSDKKEDIKFAWVNVKLVDESFCEESLTHRPVLSKYLKFSGFETIKEWEDEICILNRGNRMPLYLKIIKVELLGKLI